MNRLITFKLNTYIIICKKNITIKTSGAHTKNCDFFKFVDKIIGF